MPSVCYPFFVPSSLTIRKIEMGFNIGSSLTGSEYNLEFPYNIVQTE